MSPIAVEVVDVGPRDGLQNEPTVLPTAVKVELIRRLIVAGVRRLEVTSFVRPDLVPQLADAEAVMTAVAAETFWPPGVSRGDVRLIGLVLNERGLRRAVEAGVDEVTVVVAAGETFSRRNQNVGREQMLDVARRIAADAAAAGIGTSAIISTAFGCPFEGEIDPDAVLSIAAACLDAGYPEVALADTIGVAVPAQVRALAAGVGALAAERGLTPRLRAHFHNTRNTGYANAVAAVEAGVTVLDAAVGGIGGCPFAPNATGNIATEDLVYLLHRSGLPTGIDQEAVAATGTWLGERLGREVPALLGRAGPFPVSSTHAVT